MDIMYTNTPEEVAEGFRRFKRKYGRLRSGLTLFACAVGAVLGVNFIFTNPAGFYGYVLVAACAFLLVSKLTEGGRTERKMLDALAKTPEETYSLTASGGVLTVVTTFPNSDREPFEERIDSRTEEISCDENERLFLLFVNRRIVYIFPKRCVSGEQIEFIRNNLG